jgi:Mg/Co/Ni transporter MgtE
MSDFLTDLLGKVDEKKLTEAINKAKDIMNKNSKEDIMNAFAQKDFSKIMPEADNADISKMIDSLSEDKKAKLLEKFNSKEVQDVLKKDKNQGIDMLKKWVEEQ